MFRQKFIIIIIIITLCLNILPLFSQNINFTLNENDLQQSFGLSKYSMIHRFSNDKHKENFNIFPLNSHTLVSFNNTDYLKKLNNNTSPTLYFNTSDEEEQETFYMSAILLGCGYLLSSDKKYEGAGFLCSFMGGAGAMIPLWRDDVDYNKTKGYFKMSGFGLAFACGIFHCASSEPADPLGGALISTGILVLTVLGDVILF